jgi:hypothetical protein
MEENEIPGEESGRPVMYGRKNSLSSTIIHSVRNPGSAASRSSEALEDAKRRHDCGARENLEGKGRSVSVIAKTFDLDAPA